MIGGVALAPATGGTSLTATYAAFTYLGADSAYSAIEGHSFITGTQLTTEERIWAGIDSVVTIASMGSAAYLTKLAKSGAEGSTLLKNLAMAGKHADNANDVSKVIYSFATGQDPNAALQNLVLGQVMGLGMNSAGNYIGKKFGAPTVDVPGTKPSHLDVPLQTKQIPNLDPANVRLSSRQDLHLKASPADTSLAKLKNHPAVSLDVPKVKEISGDNVSKAVSGVKPSDVDVPKVKGVHDVEVPKYNKEQILRNIEESRLARESSGFKDFATREKYLEKVFDKLTPEERKLIFNISKDSPKVKYKNGVTPKEILEINKGDRPNPEDIYNSTYLKMHNQQFKNGASRFQKFQPSESWNGGIVGGKDGTSFWLSKEHADIIEKVADGDNRLYEIILGLDEGYLEDGPLYRLDVTPEVVAEKGISIPSGREAGANDWWRPTGRTFPGDIPEGVMKDISTKRGEHTWNIVN